MKDVVLVPTWDRPEMLHYCLKRLAAADGIESCEVRVLVDAHFGFGYHLNPQITEVLNEFPQLEMQVVRRKQHPYHGNSANVLDGYRKAFEDGAQVVYLVEDDVLVARDFFRWHRAVMQQGRWFCSIATQCTRRKDWPMNGNVSGFWTSQTDYASLGVCLPRESLARIVPHARDEYFRQPTQYMYQQFKDSNNGFSEQDGLIMRVLRQSGLQSAWPCVPRAWHAGFWGYNRRDRTKPWDGLALGDKIRYLGEVLTAPSEMKKLAGNYPDVFVPDDTPHDWENVELAARLK